jgi:hypothetical protein
MPTLEWSHDKRRATSRTPAGDVPALPAASVETDSDHAPHTGRFVVGNRAARRRQVKTRAKGIATLNPATVPSWLSPYVTDGVALAGELAQRFPDDPALRPLIGATVDAWVVFRALLALGAQGDGEALKESRAWLREHRAALATLSGLAGELRTATADPRAAFDAAVAEIAEEQKAKGA